MLKRPSQQAFEGVLSIRGDADGVKFYFNRGKMLPDPEKLLKGSASLVRFIELETGSTIARPAVASLIEEAIARNPVPFALEGNGSIVIRSTSTSTKPAKQKNICFKTRLLRPKLTANNSVWTFLILPKEAIANEPYVGCTCIQTKVHLRPVTESDLPILFEHQRESEANEMAAFPAQDHDETLGKSVATHRLLIRLAGWQFSCQRTTSAFAEKIGPDALWIPH